MVASYGAGSDYAGDHSVKVHHNRIWVRGTGNAMGGYDDTVNRLYSETTNEWHHNEYHVQSLSDVVPGGRNWFWATRVPYTWAEWQATGKDVGSTRTLI
jgi:hypothetical protein